MIEAARRLLIGLALAGYACTGGGKPPQPPTPPTPTPPPAANYFPELLVRQPSPPRLTRGGQPWEPFGAIQCCMPAPAAVGNSRWPLASASWMDYTKASMFHFRLGPFYARPGVEDEDEWDDIGGPYAGGPGSDFNAAFDAKLVGLVQDAGKRKAVVEIDPIDTWVCKRASSKQGFGDVQMPWPQPDIDACGIEPSPEQEKFLRHVVATVGCYQNVIWITDNEGGEIRGARRSWYEWVHSVLRDEEQKSGCGVVHLIGTNNTDFCGAPFDYCATHDRAALTQPIAANLHSENNERNPAFSVEEEASNFRKAREAGLNWWYWRAEQTEPEMERTLALFRGEESIPDGCFAPPAEDPRWVVPPQAGAVGESMRPAVEAAKAAVGDRCGKIGPCDGGPGEPEGHHCQQNVTLGLVASELRKQGFCASGPWADAVAVLNPQGLWQEFHAVAFGTGCYTNDAAQLPKASWTFSGPAPTPPPAPPPSGNCANPPAQPVDNCSIKEHTKGPNWTVVDSTFKVHDAAYCASIGFTDGRVDCPVRPEGDPMREACEAEVIGTPVYTTTIAGSQPDPSGNPYLFRVPRGQGGSVTVHASKNPPVSCTVEVAP